MFRGNELIRLMTMVVMLGVILLLIVRSGNQETWAWLVNNSNAAVNKPDHTDNSAMTVKAEEAEPASGGPTDLDPEELDAIREEFQVVRDGTLDMPPVENHVYDRLLQWVGSQTISQMRKRAAKNAVFTQFYQSPEKYRGKLFEMEMNVRRVLKYQRNGLDLYEVWGWTNESRSWPYVGVVIDLPKGMPIGPEVYEQVTLVGYFFKMQGYMEAGAKPRSAPLQAPLFVGRLIWYRSQIPQAQRSDWTWGLVLLGGFLIFLIIRWGLFIHGSRRRSFSPPTVQAKPGDNPVEEWLANVESEAQMKKNDPDSDRI
jgi:hypothetical protein